MLAAVFAAGAATAVVMVLAVLVPVPLLVLFVTLVAAAAGSVPLFVPSLATLMMVVTAATAAALLVPMLLHRLVTLLVVAVVVMLLLLLLRRRPHLLLSHLLGRGGRVTAAPTLLHLGGLRLKVGITVTFTVQKFVCASFRLPPLAVLSPRGVLLLAARPAGRGDDALGFDGGGLRGQGSRLGCHVILLQADVPC